MFEGTIKWYFDQHTGYYYYATDDFVMVLYPNFNGEGYYWIINPVIHAFGRDIVIIILTTYGYEPDIKTPEDVKEFAISEIKRYYKLEGKEMYIALGFSIDYHPTAYKDYVMIYTDTSMTIIDCYDIDIQYQRGDGYVPVKCYPYKNNGNPWAIPMCEEFYFTNGWPKLDVPDTTIVSED